MAAGWIKLYRQVLDNPIVCRDSDYFTVWCYLLLAAAHQDQPVLFGGKKIILKPGQLITGRVKIAEQFHIQESKVQRILKALEDEGQITQETSSRNRLITIVEWERYQDGERQQNDNKGDVQNPLPNGAGWQCDKEKRQQSEQQATTELAKTDNKNAENRQQNDSQTRDVNPLPIMAGGQCAEEKRQQSEQQMNTLPTTNEQQNDTNKKFKNVRNKEEKNNNPPLSPQGEKEEWHARFAKPLADKLDEWLEYKRQRRQNYKPVALKSLLNKAEKAAAEYGDAAVADVIEYSMANNYQGIVWNKIFDGASAKTGYSKRGRQPPKGDFKSEERDLNFMIE